jgi:hypothetical protein
LTPTPGHICICPILIGTTWITTLTYMAKTIIFAITRRIRTIIIITAVNPGVNRNRFNEKKQAAKKKNKKES